MGVEDIKAKIRQNKIDFERLSEGSKRAVDSFNFVLEELFNPKLMAVRLTGSHSINEPGLVINCSLMFMTPQGWQMAPVGKLVRAYPIPSEDEVCKWIDEEITKWVNDQYSMLTLTLTHLTEQYSQITRKQILER